MDLVQNALKDIKLKFVEKQKPRAEVNSDFKA